MDPKKVGKFCVPPPQPKLITVRNGVKDPTNKGIDLADIVDLRKRGLSYAAIAKTLGCTKRNVVIRLKGVMKELDGIEEFKSYRGDILAVHQRRILDTITKGTIKEAGLRDRVIAMGVLFDKERIATGKTTGGGDLTINVINYSGAAQSGQITKVEVRGQGNPLSLTSMEE